MAETSTGPKRTFGFLAQKAGPLPIGVWLLAAIGIYYYLSKRQSSANTPAAAQSQTGYGTDPAGNTGYIDPQSGYVYGSAEDIAGLQQQGQVAGNTYTGSGTGGAGLGSYADNNAWAQAAINYLVARGIDPTEATNAIESYLSSQALTTQEQADVNLAIQGLGAPPSVPGPSQTQPGQVVTPPSNPGGGTPQSFPPQPGTYVPQPGQPGAPGNPSPQPVQYPAPAGLSAYSVSSTGYRIKWNAVTGPHGEKPTGYTVATYQMNGVQVDQFTTSGTDTSEYGSGGGGLHPGWQYRTNVWANGGQSAPPHASVTVSLKNK